LPFLAETVRKMRLFCDLTKSGIVVFVLLSGTAGYALSHSPYAPWDFFHLGCAWATLYFLSAGSFALNQAQEWRIDRKMPRTENRPIPSGRVSALQGWAVGFGFVAIGLFFGLLLSPLVALLGLATVLLYNLLYTTVWKRRWAFAAVPGAIPGAMPVVIGYAANAPAPIKPDIVYAFAIMFLWQMPHFWSLALRFKDDYAKGGIPVLPIRLGDEKTLFHMGLYIFAYAALAVASPWFVSARWSYAVAVVPFAFKVLWEFNVYYRHRGKAKWLPFFLWTNFSLLVFLIAPVVDKWQLAYAQP
jgi:protoheme IX farnesyltransferase